MTRRPSAAPSDRAIRLPRRLPTGARLLLLLGAALLPLALLAAGAALWRQTTAMTQIKARAAAAARQEAHALSAGLRRDMAALRRAATAVPRERNEAQGCARAARLFADRPPPGVLILVRDRSGRVLCGGTALVALADRLPARADRIGLLVEPARGILLSIADDDRQRAAHALFSAPAIAGAIARRDGAEGDPTTISANGRSVPIADRGSWPHQPGFPPVSVPLGIGTAMYTLYPSGAASGHAVLLAVLVPVMLWAAATLICWLIVDRLLLKPLRALHAQLQAHQPGVMLAPGDLPAITVQEVHDLGAAFQAIAATVHDHEQRLADGLLHQTALTRDVHHRVKNNLQIISSLINLHARGARSADAGLAYTSIQRRVDALAVVHRNHFAAMEETRGLNLRGIISDLTANLRASVPEAESPAIRLDFDTTLVSQDVAIAVAFLITEIVELAMLKMPGAPISLRLAASATPDHAVLEIASPALRATPGTKPEIADLYGRVIGGLARQLRNPIAHDAARGSYTIDIAATGRD